MTYNQINKVLNKTKWETKIEVDPNWLLPIFIYTQKFHPGLESCLHYKLFTPPKNNKEK